MLSSASVSLRLKCRQRVTEPSQLEPSCQKPADVMDVIRDSCVTVRYDMQWSDAYICEGTPIVPIPWWVSWVAEQIAVFCSVSSLCVNVIYLFIYSPGRRYILYTDSILEDYTVYGQVLRVGQ
jgi:hypothetical protein